MTIFEAKHLLSPLLWNMFYREVEVSDCMQTLFRGNSLGSKIMAFCFKIYGSSYLQNLLAPLILPLIDGEVKSFEVDPTRYYLLTFWVLCYFELWIQRQRLRNHPKKNSVCPPPKKMGLRKKERKSKAVSWGFLVSLQRPEFVSLFLTKYGKVDEKLFFLFGSDELRKVLQNVGTEGGFSVIFPNNDFSECPPRRKSVLLN